MLSNNPIHLTLITGNSNKLREISEILGNDFVITNEKYDIQEIQGLPRDVAKHKAKSMANLLGKPVLIEDTSLYLKELPQLGAFIKWFGVDENNNDNAELQCNNFYKISKGFDDKTLYAMCVFAYCCPEKEPILFEGSFEGQCCPPEVGKPEKGVYFGWDPIMFDPNSKKSFAQMTSHEKNLISHRRKALDNLKLNLLNEIKS